MLPEHSIISVTGNDRVYGRTLIRTSNDASSVTTYKIGALVKYRCERGYKILGDPLSTCEDNGQWSGEIPQCVCKLNFCISCQILYYCGVFLMRIFHRRCGLWHTRRNRTRPIYFGIKRHLLWFGCLIPV